MKREGEQNTAGRKVFCAGGCIVWRPATICIGERAAQGLAPADYV
jgi:hypothetical protein